MSWFTPDRDRLVSYRRMRPLEIAGPLRDRSWAALLLAGCLVVVAIVGVVLLKGVAPQPVVAPPATSSTPVGAVVMVHVAGEVKSPGLYELPEGSRIADAIEMAGGPRRSADLDALNLAQIVIDGSRIEVLSEVDATSGTVPSAAASSSTISLNVADQAALETIPGVGPVTAAAIIAHRTELGGFTSLDQLLEVSGIGPLTFESIAPYLSL